MYKRQDYVRAMWLMLQQDTPDDFVIATNETRTVREFVAVSYTHLDVYKRQIESIDNLNITKKARELAEKLGVDLNNLALNNKGNVIKTKDVQEFYDNAMQKKNEPIKKSVFKYDRERIVIIGAGNGAEVVCDILLDDYDLSLIHIFSSRFFSSIALHIPVSGFKNSGPYRCPPLCPPGIPGRWAARSFRIAGPGRSPARLRWWCLSS